MDFLKVFFFFSRFSRLWTRTAMIASVSKNLSLGSMSLPMVAGVSSDDGLSIMLMTVIIMLNKLTLLMEDNFLREDQLRWTFKLYDASGDGVLEQQEVGGDDADHDHGDVAVHDHGDVADHDHGDVAVHDHDDCEVYYDLFQVLLIMQSIQGAFSREETGISRSFEMQN